MATARTDSASPATFSSSRLSLLDRGMAYAIAHIRGGDEMGEKWREDGMLMKKKNTFWDFIDSAEYLISEKWTSKDRLVIEGGSAGGLLMGAVVNMRPDLFHAVHAAVPFVDVMNTMMDASLPLTVGEYLEWGNPNEKAAYDYMKTYSPYDNLEKRAYPAILVTTSFNDSQVMYWEPAKYVARLRTLKTDDNPLLSEDQDGPRRPRRRIRTLRPAEGPGVRIRLAAGPGGNYEVAVLRLKNRARSPAFRARGNSSYVDTLGFQVREPEPSGVGLWRRQDLSFQPVLPPMHSSRANPPGLPAGP